MEPQQQRRTIGPVTRAAGVGTGVAGALALLIAYVLNVTIGLDVPDYVQLAGGVVLTWAGTWIGGLLARPTGGDHARE